MVAPTGTAADFLLQLQSTIAAAFGEDTTRKQRKKLGLVPIADTPAKFAKELAQERETWNRVIARPRPALE